MCVGVDAYIDPAVCTGFTEIFGEFDGTQWGDVLNRPLRALCGCGANAYLCPLSYGIPSAFGALERLEVKARMTMEAAKGIML